MIQTKERNNYPGRVNAVFVLNIGGEEKAIVTSIIALAVPKCRDDIRFAGPACFSLKTARHIEKVVLPVAKTILRNLKIPEMTFEISVVNLDVAAAHDVGLEISGFSTDEPIFLAILSAGLKIPIHEKAVFTGHIASKNGDIRMVQGMPAKLKAVTEFGSFNSFFHPVLSSDNSFDQLSPRQKERIEGLLCEAKRSIRTISVRDVAELVNQVFTDEQIAYGTGFVLDKAASKSRSVYQPNTKFLNKVLEGRNNEFVGIVHSHPAGFRQLSAEDQRAAWSNMTSPGNRIV